MNSPTMTIASAIVKFGTEAVCEYRTIAGLTQDNELPEIYLGGVIASRLHQTLNINAHVERYYTDIAADLGVVMSPSLIQAVGGQRADVAAYKNGKPIAIIELKKFDDGKYLSGIVSDRDKLWDFAKVCNVESYLGILITDVSSRTRMERAQQLEKALGKSFDELGEHQRSVDGGWQWFFACQKVL